MLISFVIRELYNVCVCVCEEWRRRCAIHRRHGWKRGPFALHFYLQWFCNFFFSSPFSFWPSWRSLEEVARAHTTAPNPNHYFLNGLRRVKGIFTRKLFNLDQNTFKVSLFGFRFVFSDLLIVNNYWSLVHHMPIYITILLCFLASFLFSYKLRSSVLLSVFPSLLFNLCREQLIIQPVSKLLKDCDEKSFKKAFVVRTVRTVASCRRVVPPMGIAVLESIIGAHLRCVDTASWAASILMRW